VRRVLDQPEALASRKVQKLRHPRGDEASDVHGDDPAVWGVRRRSTSSGENAERFRVHIDEHRPPARVENRRGGGEEGVRRARMSRPLDTEGPQDDLEGLVPLLTATACLVHHRAAKRRSNSARSARA